LLANDPIKSPISLLSKATAECVVEWMENLERDNLENVLLSIGLQEIRQILRMSPEVTERFFRVFWYQDKDIYSKIALAELQYYPNSSV
jgi:hypothetical protein